jgi:secondary thiamine-phosphate synthase enzyme
MTSSLLSSPPNSSPIPRWWAKRAGRRSDDENDENDQPHFGLSLQRPPAYGRFTNAKLKPLFPMLRISPREAAVIRQFVDILSISTTRRGLVEITREVLDWLEPYDLQAGLLTLFCRHTSAGLLIQENAAREVRGDLEAFFDRASPEDGQYRHRDEGADDMPAHIRTVLTGVQLAIPILRGKLALGTWQGIYLFEHRRAPHQRQIALHLVGE